MEARGNGCESARKEGDDVRDGVGGRGIWKGQRWGGLRMEAGWVGMSEEREGGEKEVKEIFNRRVTSWRRRCSKRSLTRSRPPPPLKA
jgi:hypothetical protein